MTTRAMVLTRPGQLAAVELPLPEIGPDDGLLRVEACGICGSDVALFQGKLASARTPLIPGHEILGVIEAVGDEAAQRWGVAVGDRVAVEPSIPCGRCRACRSGWDLGCEGWGDRGFFGYGHVELAVAPALWGGYAERMYLHPQTLVHHVPSDVPTDAAVLFQALAGGIDWTRIAGTGPDDVVVVLGAGQRGLACVVAARDAGARRIVVTGLARDRHKLELARALGADSTVVVDTATDVVGAVRAALEGESVDVVMDLTPGVTRSVADAVRLVRHRGTVVLVGLKGDRPIDELRIDEVIDKAVTLRGAFGVDHDAYGRAIALITSTPGLARMTTHAFALEDAESAVRTLAGEVPGQAAISVSIRPGD